MGVQEIGYHDLYATHAGNTRLLRSRKYERNTKSRQTPPEYKKRNISTFVTTVEFHSTGPCYPDRLGLSGKYFLNVNVLHLFMV
jgi:hypothetical protein